MPSADTIRPAATTHHTAVPMPPAATIHPASTIEQATAIQPAYAKQPEDAIERAAAQFPPITLAEMEAVKLLNRVDSKYVTTEATLLALLGDAQQAGYRALEAQGDKLSPYNSVYYDTPELKTFLDHHNKRLVRQKIRTRVYVNSGDTFLEIKRKNNHGRTKKKRTQIETSELMDFSSNTAATAYLAEHSMFTSEELSPALSTAFERITLVNPQQTERLTIDTALRFTNFRTGRKASLQDAVIIELKQDGRAQSQMKGILLRHRVKELRISKYCIGTTLTDSAAKSNRFKEKVRAIEKVTGQKLTTP